MGDQNAALKIHRFLSHVKTAWLRQSSWSQEKNPIVKSQRKTTAILSA